MRLNPKYLLTFVLLGVLVFVSLKTEKDALIGKGDVYVSEHPNRYRTVVFSWYDDISAPMSLRFEEAFAQWADKTDTIIIDLDSPGGSLIEGQKVIDVINAMKRSHTVETQVKANRYCLSMCVPIYLQGQRRLGSVSSRWMFHEPKLINVFTDEIEEQNSFDQKRSSYKFFNRYFVNSPMDEKWREKLREEWTGKDVWFTGAQLIDQQANIIQETI